MTHGHNDKSIENLQKKLKQKFGISHATFQIQDIDEETCKIDCK
jgi:ribosomal protein S3